MKAPVLHAEGSWAIIVCAGPSSGDVVVSQDDVAYKMKCGDAHEAIDLAGDVEYSLSMHGFFVLEGWEVQDANEDGES